MGYFVFSTPISYLQATSIGYQFSSLSASISRVSLFRTSYLYDPWMLPSLCYVIEDTVYTEMVKPLSVVEVAYQAIQQTTVDLDQTPSLTEF
jgi:hypothetical protein